MAKKNVGNEITRYLTAYINGVERGMLSARESISKEAVKKLREKSPKKTGDYKKGWRVTTEKRGKKIVHNKTDYQLTHLLEFGHANVNGGRTPAKVHIRPVAEEAVEKYIKETERLIRK